VAATNDFSLQSLYEALDARRQARGLSWSAALREIRRASDHPGARPLSLSTVKGVGRRAIAEGDGVLQMLRWLNRTPESFMLGTQEIAETGGRLLEIPAGKVLRFDTKKMFTALNARRAERKMTWAQVAEETGWSVAALTRLSKGGRTAFPTVMRIVRWLGEPAVRFIRISDR
jgi:ribosomal protein L24E